MRAAKIRFELGVSCLLLVVLVCGLVRLGYPDVLMDQPDVVIRRVPAVEHQEGRP